MTSPSSRDLLASMPFAVALGIEIDTATADEVTGRLPWAADRCTIGGAMHGGALMALADSLGAICAFLNLPEGASGTSTIESKTNFFRGLREGHVAATSRPLHAGRTTVVVQTDLVDGASGKRIAQVTQTQAVISRSG